MVHVKDQSGSARERKVSCYLIRQPICEQRRVHAFAERSGRFDYVKWWVFLLHHFPIITCILLSWVNHCCPDLLMYDHCWLLTNFSIVFLSSTIGINFGIFPPLSAADVSFVDECQHVAECCRMSKYTRECIEVTGRLGTSRTQVVIYNRDF